MLIRTFVYSPMKSGTNTFCTALKWRGRIGQAIKAVLPPLNFLTVHYVYFVSTNIIASVIFYLTATPWRSVAYIDSLFMCVSAMTGAGLNTVHIFTLPRQSFWIETDPLAR
jgi:hypothetical protein